MSDLFSSDPQGHARTGSPSADLIRSLRELLWAMHHDHEKYPQLRLPDMQASRLMRALGSADALASAPRPQRETLPEPLRTHLGWLLAKVRNDPQYPEARGIWERYADWQDAADPRAVPLETPSGGTSWAEIPAGTQLPDGGVVPAPPSSVGASSTTNTVRAPISIHHGVDCGCSACVAPICTKCDAEIHDELLCADCRAAELQAEKARADAAEAAREKTEGELRAVDAVMARRPALDRETLRTALSELEAEIGNCGNAGYRMTMRWADRLHQLQAALASARQDGQVND